MTSEHITLPPSAATSPQSPTARRLITFSAVLGILICAIALGVGAASEYGTILTGAVMGIFVCGVATAIYVRDPVLAFIWLWLFEVFNAPISAAVGYNSTQGEAVRQGDEVLVLLLLSLTLGRYLNELRADDYLQSFSRKLVILKEDYTLEGTNLLTPQIRSELQTWSEEDLTRRFLIMLLRKQN